MWVKLSDRMPDDPDVDRLSHGAFRLLIAAWCYCARHESDGVVPTGQLPRLIPGYKTSFLSELGQITGNNTTPLLARTTGGYLVRNWTKYNHSKAWWNEKRTKDADRLAQWREENVR